MRVVITSDSHGRTSYLEEIFEKERCADAFLFLGDGVRDWEAVTALYPDRRTIAVAGNCDGYCGYPECAEVVLGGKRVFLTHGHIYKVKYGLYRLACAARERQADVVLFGHTHSPLWEQDDALTLVNPGSLGCNGRYAVLDIGARDMTVTQCSVD